MKFLVILALAVVAANAIAPATLVGPPILTGVRGYGGYGLGWNRAALGYAGLSQPLVHTRGTVLKPALGLGLNPWLPANRLVSGPVIGAPIARRLWY